MADVFISYARSTYAQARAIADALVRGGYSVWVDDDLPAHRAFSTVIEENLIAARAVLVLWSRDARQSRWVPAEADVAYSSDKLVQFSLDGTLPPLPFNRVHCEVARGWDGDLAHPAWIKIMASIDALLGHTPTAVLPPDPRGVSDGQGKAPLLAVLAFDNLSPDNDLDYFCDGVSEEIQRTVARGSTLKVVARSSSFQFRGADKTTARVAAALGATHLLDGTVRRGGEKIRISAELVECAGSSTIWTEHYDGDLRDVFALQEKIAASVAHALKVALAPSTPSAPLSHGSYERFLRARAVLADGDPLYDNSAFNAIPLLESVVAAEPDYAPAWEALANARACALRSSHWERPYTEGRDGVLEAANTALRLDPKRSGAWAALAMLEPWGAYAKREALLDKALAASPNDPVALTDMSNFRLSVGQSREALRLAEQAYEMNPLMPASAYQVAQLLAYDDKFDDCIRMHQDLHRRWPSQAGILMGLLSSAAYFNRWDAYDEAADAVDDFDGWQGADLRALCAFADAMRSRDPELIEKRVARYADLLERTGSIALNLVASISALGQTEKAFDLAERSSYDFIFQPEGNRPSAHYTGTMMGKWSQMNRSPRFVELCHRLGLCRYWADSGNWPDCAEWLPYDLKAETRRLLSAGDR